eukprot:gene2145-2439_t
MGPKMKFRCAVGPPLVAAENAIKFVGELSSSLNCYVAPSKSCWPKVVEKVRQLPMGSCDDDAMKLNKSKSIALKQSSEPLPGPSNLATPGISDDDQQLEDACGSDDSGDSHWFDVITSTNDESPEERNINLYCMELCRLGAVVPINKFYTMVVVPGFQRDLHTLSDRKSVFAIPHDDSKVIVYTEGSVGFVGMDMGKLKCTTCKYGASMRCHVIHLRHATQSGSPDIRNIAYDLVLASEEPWQARSFSLLKPISFLPIPFELPEGVAKKIAMGYSCFQQNLGGFYILKDGDINCSECEMLLSSTDECGLTPDILVCDGTSLGFRKQLLSEISESNEKDQIIPRKSDYNSRLAIQHSDTWKLFRKSAVHVQKRKPIVEFSDEERLMRLLEEHCPKVFASFIWIKMNCYSLALTDLAESISSGSPVCAYNPVTEVCKELIGQLSEDSFKSSAVALFNLQQHVPLVYGVISIIPESQIPEALVKLFEWLYEIACLPFKDKSTINGPPVRIHADPLAFFPTFPKQRERGGFAMDQST